MNPLINELKQLIKEASFMVVMTGAGISVPSGIPDFRGSSGLYQTNPEEVLSHTYFMKHQNEFFDFYKSKMIYQTAKPSIAHETLTRLEAMGKIKAIITQNIDSLHQAAGSKNVLELHGTVHINKCMKCHSNYSLKAIMDLPGIPTCDCGGVIKPEVVLYEEPLDYETLNQAVAYIERADLLMVVGTSLVVNPAAALVGYLKRGKLVIINKSPTPYDYLAKLIIREPLETILTPDLLE